VVNLGGNNAVSLQRTSREEPGDDFFVDISSYVIECLGCSWAPGRTTVNDQTFRLERKMLILRWVKRALRSEFTTRVPVVSVAMFATSRPMSLVLVGDRFGSKRKLRRKKTKERGGR